MEMQMEVSKDAPSWLSIVTKAKRFPVPVVVDCVPILGHQEREKGSGLGTGLIPLSRLKDNSKRRKEKEDGGIRRSSPSSPRDTEKVNPMMERIPPASVSPPTVCILEGGPISVASYRRRSSYGSTFQSGSGRSDCTLYAVESTSHDGSPRLRSSGSASSVDDDMSTSALSAFSSSSSPSPMSYVPYNLPPSNGMNISSPSQDSGSSSYHHHPNPERKSPCHSSAPVPNNESKTDDLTKFYFSKFRNESFHLKSILPEIVDFRNSSRRSSPAVVNADSTPGPVNSNRVSVIKSTRTIRPQFDASNNADEPEDLSMKRPKRLNTPPLPGIFRNPNNSNNSNSSSNNVRTDSSSNRNDEDNCVQDLSLPIRGSSSSSRSSNATQALPQDNDNKSNSSNADVVTTLCKSQGPMPNFPTTAGGPINPHCESETIFIKKEYWDRRDKFAQRQWQKLWKFSGLTSADVPPENGVQRGTSVKTEVKRRITKLKPAPEPLGSSNFPSPDTSLPPIKIQIDYTMEGGGPAVVKEEKTEGDLMIVDIIDTGCDKLEENPTSFQIAQHSPLPSATSRTAPTASPEHSKSEQRVNSSPKRNDGTPDAEADSKGKRGRKRNDDDTKHDCFLCNFSCVKENVLKNHMVRMHTVKGNRGTVKCTVCGFACPTLEELRTHQELIHGQGTKEEKAAEPKVAFHACSHCTKKFRSLSQLEAHLRLIAQKQLWKDLKTRRGVTT